MFAQVYASSGDSGRGRGKPHARCWLNSLSHGVGCLLSGIRKEFAKNVCWKNQDFPRKGRIFSPNELKLALAKLTRRHALCVQGRIVLSYVTAFESTNCSQLMGDKIGMSLSLRSSGSPASAFCGVIGVGGFSLVSPCGSLESELFGVGGFSLFPFCGSPAAELDGVIGGTGGALVGAAFVPSLSLPRGDNTLGMRK